MAILQRGELARHGTVADLTRQEGRYVVGLAAGQAFPTDDVARLGYRAEPHEGRWEVVTGTDPDAIDKVLFLLAEKGLKVRHLVEKKQSLEDVFMTTVEGAEPGVDRKPRKRGTARPVGGGE